MVINRILNNNVIITIDKNGKEIIVMGKGIGYQKTKGESIDDSKVNKVFKMVDTEVSNKLQELLYKIPIEHIQLSDEIIEYAQSKLNKRFNENIYISLSDHTYSAIQRFKNGISIKNTLIWEIKRFYKDEFALGMKALDIIEEKINIRLPEDEAGFIAFHLVNAQLNEENPIVYEITKLMHEILNIVRYTLGIEFEEESVYYYRFVTHLKFFSQRLFSQNEYSGETDEDILNMVKFKYKEEFDCIIKVKDFIKKQYNYILTDDEIMYLTIHVGKIVRESSINAKK